VLNAGKASRFFIPVLKLCLAATLIGWMIYGGKLNLGDVAGAFRQWPDLLLIAAFYYGCVLLTSLRWHMLLLAEKVRIRFRKTFALTMIGLLFNTLIPSSVGGDVVKAYYLTAYAADRKARALTTILIDRALGLLVLLLMATAAVLWNLPVVRANRPVALFATSICVVTVVGIAALAVAILLSGSLKRALERFTLRVPRLSLLVGVVQVFETYRRKPSLIPCAIGVNLAGPLLATMAFYFSMRSLALPGVPFGVLLVIVPLGLVSLAVPVTPAGIGVGQVAFYTLFEAFAGGRGADGATAFTVFQFVSLMIYLSGLLFYVRYKRPSALDKDRAIQVAF
jgi:uncharacterized protein (TIRG00374 family)